MATRFPVSSIAGDMISLRSAMDRLLNESYVPGQGTGTPRGVMPLDVYASENEVVVLAAVPGMSADDIQITIEKNTVTLSGTMPNVAESEDTKEVSWYLHELPHGTFERTLTLPTQLDANRAEATFENGMLRLTLPKAETEKPRQIKVRVGDGNQVTEHAGAQSGE
jgi:HSP20 family protein